MTDDGYDPRLVTPSSYGERRPILGETVAVLHLTFERRGLKLIEAKSRVLVQNEIHELMITDEDASPGGTVDRVSPIAFFEIKRGGLAIISDDVVLAGKTLGTLAGFDLTHMPNHINFLVKAGTLAPPPAGAGDRLVIRRAS